MNLIKERLFSRITGDLASIEEALRENLTPHLGLVKETAGHLIFAGGKRLRPLLILLCSRLCGRNDSFIIKFATIFEFLHTATLLHDDIIDDASVRRGKPVAHKLFGASITVLVGDFLLARALSIASETRNPEIIGLIANVTEQMSQGEIHQLMKKGDTGLTEAEYMEVIHRKTGVLIQGACQAGAMLAGAPEHAVSALGSFGKHTGLVFQIADDVLDYIADTKKLGKKVGADLREGKLTLPVIYALSKAGSRDKKIMEKIILDPDFSPQDFETLVNLIKDYGGITYATDLARRHLAEAKKSLEIFHDSPEKETLELIAEYALKRSE